MVVGTLGIERYCTSLGGLACQLLGVSCEWIVIHSMQLLLPSDWMASMLNLRDELCD